MVLQTFGDYDDESWGEVSAAIDKDDDCELKNKPTALMSFIARLRKRILHEESKARIMKTKLNAAASVGIAGGN